MLHRLIQNYGYVIAIFMALGLDRASAAPMDVKAVVLYALDRSPTYDSAKRRVEVSEAQLKNAEAAFLPTLDVGAETGVTESRPGNGVAYKKGVNLSLKETIYDNGQTYLSYRIAKTNLETANIQFKQERDKLVLEIVKAFNLLARAVISGELEEEQYRILLEQFETISLQYRQGLKTKNDYLRFKAQTQRREIAVANAKQEIIQARQNLLSLMGVKADLPEANHFEFDIPQPTAESLPGVSIGKIDFNNTYVQLINNKQRTVDSFEEEQVRRRNWPELNLATNVNYGDSEAKVSPSRYQGGQSTTWDVTLSVTYNIWDWGVRRRNLGMAIETNIIEENERQQQELNLRASLDQIVSGLKNQKSNFDLSKELLELERSNFEFLQDEYRRGKITYLELIDALQEFETAKSQFAEAYFGYLNNYAEYRFHEGTLYDWVSSR